LDVVLNKEGHPIVCHDAFLSLVSNINKNEKYLNRKCTRTLYGKEKEDWWISDFTLSELKELNLN
jgi:glycerophosphoryl diester phosphodiesterase